MRRLAPTLATALGFLVWPLVAQAALAPPSVVSPADGSMIALSAQPVQRINESVKVQATYESGQQPQFEASLNPATYPDGSFTDPLKFMVFNGSPTHTVGLYEFTIRASEFESGGKLAGGPSATVYYRAVGKGCEEVEEYDPNIGGHYKVTECGIRAQSPIRTFVYSIPSVEPPSGEGQSAACQRALRTAKNLKSRTKAAQAAFERATTARSKRAKLKLWKRRLHAFERSVRNAKRLC